MSETLKDKVLGLLDDLTIIYGREIKYKENMLGIYARIYLNDNSLKVNNFSHEELGELSRIEIASLVEFGFKLQGVNTERMYRGSEVYFVEVDNRENNYEDTLNSIEDIVKNEVNSRYTNYIIIQDNTGDNFINYDMEFVELLEELQEEILRLEKLSIMYFNLEGNYLNNSHKTECLKKQSLSLDEDILNLGNLILEPEGSIKYYNKDVLLSKKSYELLNNIGIFNLAYLALKQKINIIFESGTIDFEYVQNCRVLFTGRYNSVDKFIKFRDSLQGTVAIKCVDGRGSRPIVVGSTQTEFKINCIKIEDVINSTDVEALALILEPYKVNVDVSRVYEIGTVLDAFTLKYAKACKGTRSELKTEEEARIGLLRKLQQVCVRILERNSVSIRNIVVFIHAEEIYFGCIPREEIEEHVEKVRMSALTNVTEEVYTTEINVIDILPTQLFLTDRLNNTEYHMPELDEEDLKAIYSGMRGKGNSSLHVSKGEYDRAMYAVTHGIDSDSSDFYEACLRIDEDLVKGKYIFETGEIGIFLEMEP